MGNDYKQTMNLPKTGFPMRANLPENEPKRLAKWEEQDIYNKVLELNADGEPFVLHDGPPYANGPIHIGHAFNKILKDFVVKSHAQRGYFTPFIPGWDCHGQPIEHEVEKKLGTEAMKAMPQSEVRELCRQWAERFIDVQRDGFKRLGVGADWDRPYLTFQPSFESANVEVFKEMYLKGAVYRGRKPIHWCKHCHTALAEAEIEYAPEKSPSLYVAFKLHGVGETFAQAGVDFNHAYVLIWTTTPWTLPANTAVSLGPDIKYCFVKVQENYYLFAYEMLESVALAAGWANYEVVSNDAGPILVEGKTLEGLTYDRPVIKENPGVFIWGDHVTLDAGTGAVHTAPGHGVEDYLVAQKFDVEVVMPVDDDGKLTAYAGKFEGYDTDEVNPLIIDFLKEQGTLVAHVDIEHSYPHCWRCHQPVIFRATDQWFVSMDKTGLRRDSLDAIDHHVQWIPEWGKNRIGAMVADRPDWCISRQRSWGVPIPVFKCAVCDEVVATEETFAAVIDLFNNEGADAWFTRKPSEYLPEDTCCPRCASKELLPEKDILDVWWESGVSHVGVLKHREKEDRLHWPADMYLEGSDQHRGWFQSSLMCGVGAYGQSPYKSVMCCGFTVDENGEKMSKSKGNGIDPREVTDSYGADVLRLWVASTDYSVDVSIGDTILQRTSDAYRRFRNTFRFLLANLDDFDFEADVVTLDELEAIDKWALVRLREVLAEVEKGYDEYRYHAVFRTLYDYMVSDLSSVYLDVIKDRLYAEAPKSVSRRAAQTVLKNILEVLVRILSPILTFTCDEVWENYPASELVRAGRVENVQLSGWPKASDIGPLPEFGDELTLIKERFESLLEVRDAVTKALETARDEKLVNKSQEARLRITAANDQLSALECMKPEDLTELFIVSDVELLHGPQDLAAPVVEVFVSELEKCPRCWNYRQLGANSAYPEVCERCAHVLQAQGE